jgi:hypothetical protein
MTQAERDRLVTLRKAKKGVITQAMAAEDLALTVRQVKRLLKAVKKHGDKAVIHGLRGKASNNRIAEETRQEAMGILSQDVYEGFGPTLASEYLADRHDIAASRETVRRWMGEAGLWRARRHRLKEVHLYRPRRSRCGELVQWDTSEHDWLEGRGEKIYLIFMIDDATSRLHARFVTSDSTAENMRTLWKYLERHGRPLAFYTDKATLFQNTVKTKRDQQRQGRDRPEMPPTQIGRALRELDIAWIAAHSPQAKGRVERGFGTAQDRLVKGMRVAGVKTLGEANQYLEREFLPWWNATLAVEPAHPDDAHRRLDKRYHLAAILSHVEERQVKNDYTLRFDTQRYQIQRASVCTGLRGAKVRVEQRLDDTVAVRFRDRYLAIAPISEPAKPAAVRTSHSRRRGKATNAGGKSSWMKNFSVRRGPKIEEAIAIANARN